MRPVLNILLRFGGLIGLIGISHLAACSTAPAPDPLLEELRYQGSVDPGEEDILLERLTTPEGHSVALIGEWMRLDAAAEDVWLGVSLLNEGREPIYPPLILELSNFHPQGVEPLNADEILGDDTPESPPLRFLYSYADSAPVLPGEKSILRQWQIRTPGLAPFRFAARLRISGEPARATISGLIFQDDDGDGLPGPDPMPFGAGQVFVESANSEVEMVQVQSDGRYEAPLRTTGLHQVTYAPPPTFAPVEITVPQPWQVVVTPNEDGSPRSVEGVDFGIRNLYCPICPSPILLYPDEEPERPRDPYGLLDWEQRGHLLVMRVGFSGCSPDHPFALWASTQLRESNPPQAVAFLEHDGRGEFCDAYFEHELKIDISPLLQLVSADGSAGPVILVLQNEGVEHRILLEPQDFLEP